MSSGYILLVTVLFFALSAYSHVYHVSVDGNDINDGTALMPLKTISAAAQLAMPGDTIVVHEGVYREEVNPPRGGSSDTKRITFMAAEGEKVEIKGSERITGWENVTGTVWKIKIPNSFFGGYNPYKELIQGDWFRDRGRIHHTGEVYLNGISLWEAALFEDVLNPVPKISTDDDNGSSFTWYCESNDKFTYIYANFHGSNPNNELVEINVRQSCFYPLQTGINYITVKGFQMRHAATQWAPPTAEQIGLIGTNWSKGWIIEGNSISDSKCTGITLGKYGDGWDNKPDSAPAFIKYNKTIARALKDGWNKENIGHHVVRNNTIFNCEQAGICGSLGAVFSEISGNNIYDIWTKRLFGGPEIAGIKLHAPIDVLIKNNRVVNTHRGIWMDWMSQGTRVTGNICYNNTADDIYFEVNHGPYIVDNNILLSDIAVNDDSQGGAYVHNLIAGMVLRITDERTTPFHKPHSTEIAALAKITGGDNRFFNNIFIAGLKQTSPDVENPVAGKPRTGYGLDIYNDAEWPMYVNGNVYYFGANPYYKEEKLIQLEGFNPAIKIEEEGEHTYLHIRVEKSVKKLKTDVVTTKSLGIAKLPEQEFTTPGGACLTIASDYFGRSRNQKKPTPGPFEEIPVNKAIKLKVW